MQEHQDVILYGGTVIRVSDDGTPATAIALRGDRITAVGSDEEVLSAAGSRPQRINLEGATVVPGFNDSHNHMIETALNWQRVDLSACRSIQDIIGALSSRAGATPAGQWVVASARWHESRLMEGRLPTVDELDQACPSHPVFVPRGGHVAVANSLALRVAGVSDDTSDPPGGHYGRDAATGRLTGELHEAPAITPIAREIPAHTAADLDAALRVAVQRYHAAGITSVRDPWITPEQARAYQTLWEAGELTIRTALMPYLDPAVPLNELQQCLESWPVRTRMGDPWLRLSGLKLVLDGGVEGGWFHQGYAQDADYYGHSLWQSDTLTAILKTAARLGWSVGMHVVGDRAFDQALDAAEAVHWETPIDSLRWALEHAFFPTPGGVERVRELNMLVTVQLPLLYELAGNMIRYWGRDRTEGIYPLRRWLDAGVLIAGGSDSYVSVYESLLGIQWMVTRETAAGPRIGLEHALTPAEALACYTRNSAYVTFEEGEKGTLDVGYYADMVILGDNPLTCDPETIGTIPILVTIAGGRLVYLNAACSPPGLAQLTTLVGPG